MKILYPSKREKIESMKFSKKKVEKKSDYYLIGRNRFFPKKIDIKIKAKNTKIHSKE